MRSNRALKIGPGGVLSCVTYGTEADEAELVAQLAAHHTLCLAYLLEPDAVFFVHHHPEVLRGGDVDVEGSQLLRCATEHLGLQDEALTRHEGPTGKIDMDCSSHNL